MSGRAVEGGCLTGLWKVGAWPGCGGSCPLGLLRTLFSSTDVDSVPFNGRQKPFSSMAVESGSVLWLSKVVLFYDCRKWLFYDC